MADPDRRDEPGISMIAGERLGGESACYAHLVCQDCGAVVSEGHRPGCAAEPAGSSSDCPPESASEPS